MPALLQVATNASGGGLERIMQQLGDAAVGRGWRSHIAYWRLEPPPGARSEYVRLPARWWRWSRGVARLCRRLHPDVIHLHGPAAGSLGAIAARIVGSRRIVYTDHAVGDWRPTRYRGARRLAARIPTVSVGVADAVVEWMLRHDRVPRDRVRCIRPGVAPAEALSPPADRASPRLVTVATLTERKDHPTLFRALSRLPPSVQLDVVGTGPLRGSLEREARDLGVSDRVRFLGFLQEPWAPAAGAWALVLSSTAEGSPLVLMEAMMRGLPPVATRVSGIPELVDDGRTGILVPAGDPGALATGILGLLDDRALRDRIADVARATALERFGVSRMIEDYFRLYEEVLAES